MEEEKKGKKSLISVFSFNEKIKAWLPLIACLLLFVLALIFDKKAAYLFSGMRNSILDFILLGVSYAGLYAIVVVPSVFVYLSNRKELIKYWFSLALTVFSVILIKMIIHRERPFQALDFTIPASLISASYSMWDFSFPSNHSALSFSSVPFLKGKFLIIWVALALLMVFSRLYFGMHYLSDVVAGIFLGYLIPILVIKYIK